MRSNVRVAPTDLIITHTDPDGFGSAALIADGLRARGRGFEVWFADYPGIGERLAAAADAAADEVYLTDLSLRERELSDELLRALCRRPVHHFDHHRLEPRRRALLQQLCATCVHEEGRMKLRLLSISSRLVLATGRLETRPGPTRRGEPGKRESG